MKVKKVIYTAIVLDDEYKNWEPVHQEKFCHHITLSFGVNEVPPFIGRVVTFDADRYYCDEYGEAVTGLLNDDEVAAYAAKHGQKLHLTISCSKNIKPVYSNELITKARGELFEYGEIVPHVGTVGCFVVFEDDSTGWIF